MTTMADVQLRGSWSSDEIVAYLHASLIPLRLAVLDSTGTPLVLSLWFVYAEEAIWCATNVRSRLAGYLQYQSRCGFEIAGDLPPYKGIRGKGDIAIVPERGGEMLRRLLDRYRIDRDSTLARSLLAKIDQEVAVRITPSRITSWDFTARMKDALTASI
ncbi:MAG: pyridoxamine 5'-phosphate oxidase family protein [Alphaproteobacteria bacterium]|nr:pyridoxamine 5'-phosphate oxidase family protein [Alphaproteobacteria bacterium]